MPNPFLRYPERAREKAKRYGIVADVARDLGVDKSTISRTFSGTTIKAKDAIIRALNDWLSSNDLPTAGANGPSVRESRGDIKHDK